MHLRRLPEQQAAGGLGASEVASLLVSVSARSNLSIAYKEKDRSVVATLHCLYVMVGLARVCLFITKRRTERTAALLVGVRARSNPFIEYEEKNKSIPF